MGECAEALAVWASTEYLRVGECAESCGQIRVFAVGECAEACGQVRVFAVGECAEALAVWASTEYLRVGECAEACGQVPSTCVWVSAPKHVGKSEYLL